MGEISCYVKGSDSICVSLLGNGFEVFQINTWCILNNIHNDTDSCCDIEALLFYALNVNWESGKDEEDKGLEFLWSFMEWSQRKEYACFGGIGYHYTRCFWLAGANKILFFKRGY